MGTKKIETKAYVVAIEYEQNRGQFTKAKLRMDGYSGPVEFSGPMVGNDILAIKRAYDKRMEVKFTIEVPQSDVEEARDLLANGQDKQAIKKALDILERLDKRATTTTATTTKSNLLT